MIDELVSFETAKLAKEKGFDIKTYNYFMGSGKLFTWNEPKNANDVDYTKELYSAPTQSLLQKWLREKHNIYIDIKSYYDTELDQALWENEIIDVKDYWNFFSDNTYYHTYEEALEAGLIEALKLIKN